MSLVNKENLLAAQSLYMERLEVLKLEINRVVERGMRLGGKHEQKANVVLDEIEKEIEGIDECIGVLKHLLRS